MFLALNPDRLRVLDWALLMMLGALVIIPALGQTRACISHEILHAEIIREMAERGDYVETKILGERIPDKPPVMHAPAALLTRWLGHPSLWVARFPSALAGILGILAAYEIGRALLDRRAALLGAVALLGMPGYSLLAREALPDMILCTGISFSCLGLVLGMRAQKPFVRTIYFALAGGAAGVAVLAKGPIGLLFPVVFAILVPFRRAEFKRPRVGWLVFIVGLLATAAIWAVPAYLRDHGLYLHQVIFQRDLNLAEAVQKKPFYLYFGVGFLLSLPLSIFLPAALLDCRRHGYSSLLAMSAAILLVFSCVPKKRDHYLLPMYPFLALGIATAIVRRTETSLLVRRVTWTLVPLSLAAMPLYFAVIQPRILHTEDPEIVFAKEVLPIIGTDGRVFCVEVHSEVLAWVAGRYDGMSDLNLKSATTVDRLRQAPKGVYLLINEKNLAPLLKTTGPLPLRLLLDRRVRKETWELYRFDDAPDPVSMKAVKAI
jgi:4-amino-4-deoxy-L-arabinose transferase-like glycosyltransferase